MAARGGDHLLDMLEASLAVIGEHDDVGLVHEALELVELRREDLVARHLFEVDPQELLLVADDAQLHRGRERGVAVQRRADLVLRERDLGAGVEHETGDGRRRNE